MLEGITRSQQMAVHCGSGPTGVACTSTGDTRPSGTVSDLSRVSKACWIVSKKGDLQNDKLGVCGPHGNTGASCMLMPTIQVSHLGATAASGRSTLQLGWSTGA